MTRNAEVPWERYALIAELAQRFERNAIMLGKTSLQKMIFLLQRAFKIDCEYAYTLYNYGPYCPDVARDLDIVEGFRGVLVRYNPSYGGYDIQPGAANEELRKRGGEFLQQVSGALEKLIADYGRSSTKDLELRSTIVYMVKPERNDEELVGRVHEVKPHFSLEQISAALQELKERQYLQ